jgi:hypothetical protein
MSVDLLETIQQNSGYPPLQKVDPNTQLVTTDENKSAEDKFSQAAIPAVLTGLYRYVQTDDGAEEILQVANSSVWINKFFDADKKAVVQTISDYSSQSYEETEIHMNAIANEAVKLVKKNLTGNGDIKEVKLFLSDQKNHILLYLLPVLNMGQLLHDNTLDDNTNKMEGPVSSLMQNIGSIFSTPVSGEEIKGK